MSAELSAESNTRVPKDSLLSLAAKPRWILFWGLAAILVLSIGAGPNELSTDGRIALIIFGLAALAWCLTPIDATYIAVVAAITPTILGIDESEEFFAMLGDSIFWLLLAAFIIAAAFTKSGLAERLARVVMRGQTTTRGLFLRLSGVILASALIVPATSGRAALFLPVFTSLGDALRDPRIVRALAIQIPVIILLSAAASLIAAGAHLVMAEIVMRMDGGVIGYFQWLVWGLPFAAASCLISTWVILQLFLNKAERQQPLVFDGGGDNRAATTGFRRNEHLVLWVIFAVVMLWVSEPLHGLHPTIVAICGALIVTAPSLGVLSLKEGIKSVNWSLLIFMAASIELGETLIESGGAQWLIEKVFSLTIGNSDAAPVGVVAMVILISLLAHLVINSRTARASVLVPMVILLEMAAGLDLMALAFVSTIAAGYCLTFPISAKPLAMFAQLEGVTFTPSDLLRLSAWLIPAHLMLLGLFTVVIWPWLGLDVLA